VWARKTAPRDPGNTAHPPRASPVTGDTRRTAAVVLNYRRAGDTVDCVASLSQLDRALDIVVVDNNSGDGSLELLRTELPKLLAGRSDIAFQELVAPTAQVDWGDRGNRALLLVGSGWNGGYAFGNNIGAKLALQRADTAFIWVLNNDTTVADASSLDALIARMDQDETIGICGSTVVYSTQSKGIQTRAGSMCQPLRGRFMPLGAGESPADPVDTAAIEKSLAYVNGAASFVRRTLYEVVGPMREDLFLYYEEYDWACRLKPRFRLGYAADSIVYHKVGAAIGTEGDDGGSPLSAYYLSRNRIRLIAQYMPASLPVAIADELLSAMRAWRAGHRRKFDVILRALTGRKYA
jgi:GT2 family glycosyltransferase